ncbi:hypothetical protein B0H14DRAFT_3552967 [Mycena olivaceomarginata]|nr:hypothetical protein B0H14DRAFT_3552967 [Mycena olivaceomarginata]
MSVPVGVGYTTLQGGPRHLYFVGIQLRNASRTFCQMREFVDPFPLVGAIFLRLQNAGGLVGRALAALVDRSEYLVGTSNFPIDIMGNYKSYQYNFHEIGSLLDLENSREAQNRFAPIPTSLTRSELLRSQEAPDNTPVFVLYLYHDTEAFTAHTSATILSAPTVPVAAPSSVVSSTPATVDGIQTYLQDRFAVRFAATYKAVAWRAALGRAFQVLGDLFPVLRRGVRCLAEVDLAALVYLASRSCSPPTPATSSLHTTKTVHIVASAYVPLLGVVSIVDILPFFAHLVRLDVDLARMQRHHRASCTSTNPVHQVASEQPQQRHEPDSEVAADSVIQLHRRTKHT